MSAEERFRSRISVTDDGCWLWLGRTNTEGYALFSFHDSTGRYRSNGRAHIYAWTVLSARAVPEGWHLDHVCHSRSTCPGGLSCEHRRCVNPDHLEPVEPEENLRRSWVNNTAERQARMLARTHCKHGHELVGNNVIYRSPTRRVCRECLRRAKREYEERRRRAAGVPQRAERSA